MIRVCSNKNLGNFIIHTPIGCMQATCCSDGLHSLTVARHEKLPYSRIAVSLDQSLLDASIIEPAQAVVEWLDSYFSLEYNKARGSHNKDFPKPNMCIHHRQKGSFTVRVWQHLIQNVDFGETISYGKLAIITGNSRAARAVGQAMKNNPFMLLVPCHRVITTAGCVGNYAGGTRNDLKHWLLKHETEHCNHKSAIV